MQTERFGARAVTAFFEHRGDAERAVKRLFDIGVERNQVTMVEHHGAPETMPERPGHAGGLFGVLSETMVPGSDRFAPVEGVHHGGFLVTAEPDDAHYEQAVAILGAEGTIDRDDRATR